MEDLLLTCLSFAWLRGSEIVEAVCLFEIKSLMDSQMTLEATKGASRTRSLTFCILPGRFPHGARSS